MWLINPAETAAEDKKKEIPEEYIRWIRENLPADFPEKTVREGMDFSLYRLDGMDVYCQEDRSNDMDLIYTAENEQDLKEFLFVEAAEFIAMMSEPAQRQEAQQKWHFFIDDKTGEYSENNIYQYDTVYDSRKIWMERMLKMMKPVVSDDRYCQMILDYEKLLSNRSYGPHWMFDEKKETFDPVYSTVGKDNTGMFGCFGFKLVVVNALLKLPNHFGQELEELKKQSDDSYESGIFTCIPEVLEYLENLKLTSEELDEITELVFDGSSPIYEYLMPDWDGETGEFDVQNIRGFEHLHNLQKIRCISMCDPAILTPAVCKGIAVE